MKTSPLKFKGQGPVRCKIVTGNTGTSKYVHIFGIQNSM